MNNDLKRMDGETQDQYFYRICNMKDSLGFTWPQMTEIFNDEFGCNKGDTAYRKKWAAFKSVLDANADKFVGENRYLEEIKLAQREIEKERKKLQTEKLEYNKWLREEARDELICERICEAIKELPPLDIPQILPAHVEGRVNGDREGCLLIADPHYGVDLKITGLFGETINEYSPEIFELRMWDLLIQVIDICEKEGFTSLNVYDLGDEVDGMLRVSQLFKLRYGVIESTVRYGRFITEWLNELSKHVYVRYQMVKDSNHCQLRMLNQPKNTFKDDNMSYIIAEKLMDRLGDNPNFEFIQNPTGYIFDTVVGYNVFGFHGEGKDMGQAIKDFSRTYKVDIDFLVGGHKHHQNSSNIGIQSDIISAPSIIGVDDYALSLNKTSDPGATLFILEEDKGKVLEYNIKL
jgi:hypothetical protein